MGDEAERNALLAHFERAAALYKGGRVDESIAALRAALGIDPKHAPSRYDLALRLESKGRYAEAAAELEAFLACASKEELRHEASVRARIAGLKKLSGQASTDVDKTLTMGPGADPPAGGTRTLGPAEARTLGPDSTMTLGDGTRSPVPPQSSLSWRPGDVVDGLYEVREVLGEGGFGSVHKVWHRGWRLELAVKAPRVDKVASRRALEAFVQEANTWVGLGLHPHVVTCFFVRLMGVPRIFIEYMPGGSLADWLAASKAKVPRVALDCAIQVARAMEYVHRRGLVHRDLKPGNCLMTADGTLKVTDFGLVHVGEDDGTSPETPWAKLAKVKSATMSGRLGTAEYMAPEQWTTPREAGKAADVWAFGVMLYELLCGRRPFEMGGDEPADSFYARLLQSGWAHPRPATPIKELDELIESCLSVDPAARYGDFSRLRAALEAAYAKLVGHAYPRAAVTEPPILADALMNQGVSMADLGRTGEALRLFGEALKLDPMHAGAMYDQGLVLLKQGKGDGNLIARLTALRRTQERDWVPAYLLGLAFHIKGQEDDAKKALMGAERLGMAHAFVEMRFADLFVALPKGTERMQAETERFRAHMGKARDLLAAGKAADAYEEVRKARAVAGYERSEQALALGREIGGKGTRAGLKGGWPALFFEGSGDAVGLELSGGAELMSRHGDGTVRRWDARTGALLGTTRNGPQVVGRTEERTADRRYMLAGKKGGMLSVVDLGDGRELMSTRGHPGDIKAVALSLDAGRAYTAGADGVWAWELDWGYLFGRRSAPPPAMLASRKRGGKRGKLVYRFLFWSLAVSLAPMSVVGWHLLGGYQETIKSESLGDQQTIAGGIAEMVSNYVAKFQSALASAVRLDGFAAMQKARQERELGRVVQQYPEILELAVVDAEGKEVARLGRYLAKESPMRDFHDELPFTVAMKGQDYMGGLARFQGLYPMLTLAVPIPGGPDEPPKGVLIGQVSLSDLSQRLKDEFPDNSRGEAAIVAGDVHNYFLVAHSDPGRAYGTGATLPEEVARAVLTQSTERGGGEIDLGDGHRVLGAFAEVKDMGWVAYVQRPVDEALSVVAVARGRLLGILAWTASIVALLALLVARDISLSIRALQSSIDGISAGRLEPETLGASRGDEIGGLSEAVGRMSKVFDLRLAGMGGAQDFEPSAGRSSRRGKLAYKLLPWFLFVSLAPTAFLADHLIWVFRQALKTESLRSQQAVASGLAEMVRYRLASNVTNLQTAARLEGFSGVDRARWEAALKRFMQQTLEYLELVLVDPRGREVVRVNRDVAADNLPVRDYSGQLPFTTAMRGGDFMGGLNRYQGRGPALTIAVPIRAGPGALPKGVLIGKVSLSWLSRCLNDDFPDKASGEAAVLAGDVRDAFLVAHSDPGLASGEGAAFPREVARAVLSQTAKRGGSELKLADGAAVLGAFSEVKDAGWVVYVQRSIESSRAMDAQMWAQVVRALLWVAIVVMLLSLAVAGHITQPIRQLQAAVERLTAGQFKDLPDVALTNDEIGDLAESFLLMSAEIKARLVERGALPDEDGD